MHVQTIQGYDLREFKGKIKLDCGTYKDEPNAPEVSRAQRKLYDRIDEDQVVWCSQVGLDLPHKSGGYFHIIDIDFRDSVFVVDSLIWCHINYNDPRYILGEDRSDLRFQASNSGADDWEAELHKLEDDYLTANVPADLWSAVIRDEITKESDQLLVKFPFESSRILDVKRITDEMPRGKRYKTLG